jgi:Family of unknown function (DUF5678)
MLVTPSNQTPYLRILPREWGHQPQVRRDGQQSAKEATMVTEVTERDHTLTAEELDKYRGKWVAIHDGRVAFAGDSPAAVIERVREAGLTGWALDHVPEDPHAIYIL